MEKFSAFPTDIYIKEHELDLERLEKKCLEFKEENPNTQRSGRGAYQGHGFRDDELETSIRLMLKEMELENKPIQSYDLFSWVNINPPGSYNVDHNHDPFAGNYWSGVYYVKLPKESGNITFNDPRGIISTSNDQKYFTNGLNSMQIVGSNNLMMIFPSWVFHSVTANLSNEDRISISFNISNVKY